MLPVALVLLLVPYAVISTCPVATTYAANVDVQTQIGTFAALKGSCETYVKDLPDGSLGFCNGIVDYEYYLPAGTTQSTQDKLAGEKATNDNPKNALLLSILPSSCSMALKRATCLGVFQRCEKVDPWFLDRGCAGGQGGCSKCGTYTANLPATSLFSATQLSPSYGNKCQSPTTGLFALSKCIAGVGKVPGLGNMLWADAFAAYGTGMTWDAYCDTYHLKYNSATKSCMVAWPRTPCKGALCDPLWNTDVSLTASQRSVNSTCPLVSGDFSASLPRLLYGYAQDDAITANLQRAYGVQTDVAFNRSSIPLLAAFQINPNCSGSNGGSVFDFAITLAGESVASNRGTGLGALMQGRANSINGAGAKCECRYSALNATTATEQPTYNVCLATQDCASLMTEHATCFSGGLSSAPNPSIKFVDVDATEVNPTCKDHIRELNQPSDQTLGGFQAAYGLPTLADAKGAFFVPPFPGVPSLAYGKQAKALCIYSDVTGTGETYTGYDAYECIVAKVESAKRLIPPFLSESCRKSYMSVLCGQAFMKMESKQLCMLESGCAPADFAGAATHTIPFNFALPRFPKRTSCESFKEECSAFIGSRTDAQQTAINAAFNCEGPIAQSCEGNNVEFNSTTWSCDSSFNGLDAFPVDSQLLANMSEFGLTEARYESVGRSAAAADTLLLLTNISTCECPQPLQVPDDPEAHTILPTVCCAERCEATLFIPSEINTGVLLIQITSTFGFLFGMFITIGWAATVNRERTPLVIFVALSVTMTSLGLMVGAFSSSDNRDVWCKDNTQHNHQDDGGVCLFQSVWLIYWIYAGFCFWACLVWDLFQKLVKGADTSKNTPVYHLISWCLPLIILTVVLGTNLAGYEPRTYWCLIGEAKSGYEAQKVAVELGMFYGGLVAIWAFGFSLLQVILFKQHKKTIDESAFNANKEIVFMCVLFSMIQAVFWGFKLIAVGRTDDVRGGAALWVGCLLGNFAAGIESPANSSLADNSLVQAFGRAEGTGCGESYPYAPGTFVLTGLALFTIGLQGFMILQTLVMKIVKPGDAADFQNMQAGKQVDADGTMAASANPTYKN